MRPGVRRLAGLFSLLLSTGILLAACSSPAAESDSPESMPPPAGTWVEPPRPVGDFTLTDEDGQPFQFSSLRGRAVLLFFGFTACPDICPTTLAEFAQTRRELGDQASRLALVFISVDGARDTPAVVKSYTSLFDPEIIGLTGDEEAIRAIGTDYGLYFAQVPLENGGYTVDHTAATFLVDAEGQLRVLFPFGTLPATIANDVRTLLALEER